MKRMSIALETDTIKEFTNHCNTGALFVLERTSPNVAKVKCFGKKLNPSNRISSFVRKAVKSINSRGKTHEMQIKIDWAVDKNGNPVVLDGIDFVRIYTAVNQSSGWMGEISTELQAVEDLHFKK